MVLKLELRASVCAKGELGANGRRRRRKRKEEEEEEESSARSRSSVMLLTFELLLAGELPLPPPPLPSSTLLGFTVCSELGLRSDSDRYEPEKTDQFLKPCLHDG